MTFDVIITGATGMVGEGVLHECLSHKDVGKILVVGRKSCGVVHPKVTEIIHGDFNDLSPIASKLSGYQACFFCLGVSSVGMDPDEYYQLTYSLTIHFAQIVSRVNSEMTFCYISGAGTDSTEKGRSRWARVKGKTENDLLKLPFKKVYLFRPGFLEPTQGLKNTLSYYKYVSWLAPILQKMAPNFISSLKELGLAMIHSVSINSEKRVFEVRDIVELSKK